MRNHMAALAAGIFALLVTPHAATYAADLGGPRSVAPVADPVDAFLSYKGGAYVGVTGGYSAAVFEAEEIDFGGQDPFVGVYTGYTFATRNGGGQLGWMFGIEGDYLLTSIETAQQEGGFSLKADSDYLASIRARAGVTWGPVALYTTGGVAFMEQTVTINGAKDSKDLVGFAGGLGAEAEITRTLTIRLEALHYRFDAEDFNVGGDTIEASTDQTIVRAGLGFKLN
jgi:outer membrane immunogenic protein